jgi:hypothetical protein
MTRYGGKLFITHTTLHLPLSSGNLYGVEPGISVD